MFGKDEETRPPMERGGDPNATSILAPGCRFKGEIEVQGTFRIEGEFEGTIRHPDSLVVGKTGHVKGSIFAKSAVIGGRVDGNVTADDKIELQSGSVLEGDIKTRRLVIDEGVVFEGSCSMGKKPESMAPKAKAPTPAQTIDPSKKQHMAS